MVVNIVEKMKSLGFSEYECKAYIALLEDNPATAYEMAKRSSIPTSKIYETISKLIEKEIITELVEAKKKRYIPCNPDELINNLSENINKNLQFLKKEFKSIPYNSNVSYILNINSYETLMQKAKSLINSAKSSLLISGWDEELMELKDNINNSNVKKALICFGNNINDIDATIFPHPAGHTLFKEKGGKQFAIISDSSVAIAGTILEDRSVEAAWSKSSGFVSVAEDFIKHDIYILKVANRFNDLLVSTYGKNYEKLRDIFNDEVIK